ncbi:carboxymuconolactone decarboxylase [Clostridium sp. UBA1056]|uniref:carboxymuconolactone decarboxylase n=1 Tax=unclassified Clostridium TaxID=2614128 RepID=UPI00321755C7
MKFDYAITISSIVNIIIYPTIIIALYKGIQCWKSFLRRDKEMDKKLDDILKKLEDKGTDVV